MVVNRNYILQIYTYISKFTKKLHYINHKEMEPRQNLI